MRSGDRALGRVATAGTSTPETDRPVKAFCIKVWEHLNCVLSKLSGATAVHSTVPSDQLSGLQMTLEGGEWWPPRLHQS